MAARLPDWMHRLGDGRAGITVLSALEATVLPIPLEAVLVPVMVARPGRAIGLALWALAGCLAGSAALYLAGWLLADPLVWPALDALGLTARFEEVADRLTGGNLFVTVLLLSVSPFPIQLAALGSGMLDQSLLVLLAGVTVARGGRYLGLGILARLIGPRLHGLRVPRWIWAVLAGLVLGLFWLGWR